ncbi:MAG: hypothetical protein ABSH13_15810 [Candidatus Acidiferrum sp.]|jgi:hypothetical protein
MSSPLAAAIANLYSREPSTRFASVSEIYSRGRSLADEATASWRNNPELSALLGLDNPSVTVGLAVEPATFDRIREANGSPRLADVPPHQDAQEFELHFPVGVALDVLTTSEPRGSGAIARYLSKFGEGIQQVEYRCGDVDRATAILKESLGITPVYPETRPGADGTRINFFLLPTATAGKVLIELYETPSTRG